MKATFTIHFSVHSAPLVTAKLQQWTEFLQATGIEASLTIDPDDSPAADLWQAAPTTSQESADE